MKKLLLILLILISSTSFGQSGKERLILFDGLYETKCAFEEDDDEGSQSYLRFYADGTVISVGTDCEGTTDELQSWFHANLEQVSRGTYKINGRKISFSTTGKTGTIYFKGQITDDNVIKIKWKSLINGEKGRDSYTFVRLPNS